jgi:1-acyl-sn-glycerol-3-phosphate acyltransferase
LIIATTALTLTLYYCNSYECLPVAKEVASWPLIGYLCKISGVICRKENAKTVERHVSKKDQKKRFNEGHSVINFPEGTTTTYQTIFNYGSFKTATQIKAANSCKAIDYKNTSDAL